MTFGEFVLLIVLMPGLVFAGTLTLVGVIAFLVWLFDRRV